MRQPALTPDVLPTLNMVYELSPDLLWRFAATKNVTRPSLGSLSYNASVSQTFGEAITSVSMGNPNLDPFESTNLDTAIEWYFEDVGYASAAIFHKDIDNFIVGNDHRSRFIQVWACRKNCCRQIKKHGQYFLS